MESLDAFLADIEKGGLSFDPAIRLTCDVNLCCGPAVRSRLEPRRSVRVRNCANGVKHGRGAGERIGEVRQRVFSIDHAVAARSRNILHVLWPARRRAGCNNTGSTQRSDSFDESERIDNLDVEIDLAQRLWRFIGERNARDTLGANDGRRARSPSATRRHDGRARRPQNGRCRRGRHCAGCGRTRGRRRSQSERRGSRRRASCTARRDARHARPRSQTPASPALAAVGNGRRRRPRPA